MKKLLQNDFKQLKFITSLLEDSHSYYFIPPRFEEIDMTELETLGDIHEENTITLFSSGSTGLPKKIVLSKKKLLLNASLSIKPFNLTKDSRVLVIASPWHVAGFTWALAAEQIGATVQTVIPYVEKLPEIPLLIDSFKPTHLFTVPGALRSFYKKNWFCDEIITGGATLQPEDYLVLKNKCSMLTQAYGQTEAGGLISFLRKPVQDYTEKDTGNSGILPKEFELEFRGEQNEIWFKSPTTISDSFYFTGDVGFFDENSDLYVTGRVNQGGGNCNSLTGITMVAHK